jgi:SAM-dependent methyltransferase
MLERVKQFYRTPVSWPSLQDEVGSYRRYLKGKVLNAGAGHRDLAPLVDGKLFNQDLSNGLHNRDIDFHAPLHEIPVADGFFDTIFCNAVLEHVDNPVEVMREFNRVLRPGGCLYLCVPFMQPEHRDPGDYQRYTQDGLIKLVRDHGFEIVEVDAVHNAYHTIGWIIDEWLRSKRTVSYLLMRTILIPVLRHRSKHSTTRVRKIASSYRIIASKLAA